MPHSVTRYHDISVGHRVHNHESKCRHLHGHNYRIHFTCKSDCAEFGNDIANAELDSVGRVIDFSVVKEKLCMWIEEHWDHKFLAWDKDPLMGALHAISENNPNISIENDRIFDESVVFAPFNPTAENMAQYLVEVVGPQQLQGTGVVLTEVRIEETAKCHATFAL